MKKINGLLILALIIMSVGVLSAAGYETPKNLLPQKHICYINFKKKHFKIKENCRSCYQSQDKRSGIDREIKLLLTRIRGSQVGCEYAEGYETLCLKI